MKKIIKTITANIRNITGKVGFGIRIGEFEEYGLKVGQEIEATIYNHSFIAPVIIAGDSYGIIIPLRFRKRYGVKFTKKKIEIKLDLTDPKEINIHKKRAARNNPAENIQQIVKNEGDPNGT